LEPSFDSSCSWNRFCTRGKLAVCIRKGRFVSV
jgi:hypothetical protein